YVMLGWSCKDPRNQVEATASGANGGVLGAREVCEEFIEQGTY
ncbi:hypothetical protein GWI33_009603, partial [Rhynchophorus ferrugineus]